jgi:peptidoglycan/LPS O-acetylase OafA/YrhL
LDELTTRRDAEGAGEARPGGFSYNPALDGIRAFAIIGVLGRHYEFRGGPIWEWGNVGVDIFFVLSGFLITTLLLRERHGTGRVSLRNFYARRALRLLPLLGVLLVISLGIYFLTSEGTLGRPNPAGILSAAFYYANWFLLSGREGLGVLAPAWSLSVEEQFYLVWPMLVVGLMALGAKRGVLLTAALVGAAASAAWRVRMISIAPPDFADFYLVLTNRQVFASGGAPGARFERSYFGSDTHADVILVGCAAAIVLAWLAPRMSPALRRAVGVAGVAAAGFVALVMFDRLDFGQVWWFKYGVPMLECSVAVVIAAVVLNGRSLLSRFLALSPLVWIGRRSYGIYLIHGFVFTFMRREIIDFGEWGSLVFQLTVVMILAAISFRYIEQPALRLKDRFGVGSRG